MMTMIKRIVTITSNFETLGDKINDFIKNDLKEIANDYFFECGGIYKADYSDFEFDI